VHPYAVAVAAAMATVAAIVPEAGMPTVAAIVPEAGIRTVAAIVPKAGLPTGAAVVLEADMLVEVAMVIEAAMATVAAMLVVRSAEPYPAGPPGRHEARARGPRRHSGAGSAVLHVCCRQRGAKSAGALKPRARGWGQGPREEDDPLIRPRSSTSRVRPPIRRIALRMSALRP
jgi:hypothetical protein